MYKKLGKKLLTAFIATNFLLLSSFGSTLGSGSLDGKKKYNISCRFSGLEELYTKHNQIQIDISKQKGKNIYKLTVDGKVEASGTVKIEIEKDLRPKLDMLRTNYNLFKSGKNSYYSPKQAEKFLKIEEPFYKDVLGKVKTIKKITFNPDINGKYAELLEELLNLYDKDNNYLATYGSSRFTGVFNFCVPVNKR